MKKLLTKEDIIQALDIPKIELEVKEWGGVIILRGLSGKEQAELEGDYEKLQGADYALTRIIFLLSRIIVDEKGAPLFSGEDGIKALESKNFEVLTRIFEESAKLNGKGAKVQEQIEKN